MRPGWWPLDPFVALDLWLTSPPTGWVQLADLRAGEPERWVEVDRRGRRTGRVSDQSPFNHPLPLWRSVASRLIRPMCRREVARWTDIG